MPFPDFEIPTFLTPDDFEAKATRLFGVQYQSAAARVIGRSRTQVFRYARGDAPIPKDLALVMILLVERLDLGKPPPIVKPVGRVNPD